MNQHGISPRRITLIARTELRLLRRERRLRILGTAFLILLALSSALSWINYHELESERHQAHADERERWLNQEAKNPHAAAHYGFHAFRPIHPLGWMETGVTPYTGVSTWLEAHVQNDVEFRPADDATSLQRFGILNPATVLTVFTPLLLIALFFDRMSGERERRTLPLLLSQGLRPAELYFGKALAALAMVLVLVTTATIPAIALLAMSDTALFSTDSLARLIVFFGSFTLFLLLFAWLAIAISALARSSSLSIGILFAFWAVSFLIAPRLLSDLAEHAHPSPTRFEFESALQADRNDRTELNQRLDAKRAELLAKYKVDDESDLPVNFRAVRLQFGEEHGYRVFDHHYNQLFDTFENQKRFSSRMAWLSPTLSIRHISMAMAGTDLLHHRTFVHDAEDYRRVIQKTMNDYLYHHPDQNDQPHVAATDLWQQVPQWEFAIPSFSSAFATVHAELTTLIVWLLSTAALGTIATGRLCRIQ